jgi:hypothetical protein
MIFETFAVQSSCSKSQRGLADKREQSLRTEDIESPKFRLQEIAEARVYCTPLQRLCADTPGGRRSTLSYYLPSLEVFHEALKRASLVRLRRSRVLRFCYRSCPVRFRSYIESSFRSLEESKVGLGGSATEESLIDRKERVGVFLDRGI